MLVTSIVGRNLGNDLFENAFTPSYSFERVPASNGITTDIREFNDKYVLELEIPGFKKEDIKAELKEGYLFITANHNESNEAHKNGKYIRRERYTGTCQRSFYVGEDITEQDIHASFENGMLTLTIPKKEAKPAAPAKRYIDIEG